MNNQKIAQVIAEVCRNGDATADQIQALLEPTFAELRKNLDQAASTMVSLSKSEGDWRFSLGDGVAAIVKFTGPQLQKRHIAAFVKVFSAMAEAYVDAADPDADVLRDGGGRSGGGECH